MELTNKQAISVLQGLAKIEWVKAPKVLGWKIHTTHKTLFPFVQVAEELIGKIQNEYAMKDPETGAILPSKTPEGEDVPNTYMIAMGDIAAYQKEIDAIHEQTFKVENVGFRLADIPDDFYIEPGFFGMVESVLLP